MNRRETSEPWVWLPVHTPKVQHLHMCQSLGTVILLTPKEYMPHPRCTYRGGLDCRNLRPPARQKQQSKPRHMLPLWENPCSTCSSQRLAGVSPGFGCACMELDLRRNMSNQQMQIDWSPSQGNVGAHCPSLAGCASSARIFHAIPFVGF